MPDLFAYTDGACSGNPGPGGWGVLMRAMQGDEVVKERELKGGEADNVILFSNISPAAQSSLKENINELRKVFYTGMTRSKRNLYIVKKQKGYVFKELYA